MGGFVVLILIVGVVIAYRMAKAREKRIAIEQFEVAQVMRVVNESLELVNNSKKADTRISRLDVAIDKLAHLRSRFPHRSDIAESLQDCRDYRPKLHTALVEEAVQKYMDKARLAKTLSGKVNSANKALEVLRDAIDDEYVDRGMLEQSVLFVRAYINAEELKDIEIKAERFEFKENYKKALDLYQDALFFLKKDDIDDAEQQSDIERIEGKIEEMRARMDGKTVDATPTRPKTKVEALPPHRSEAPHVDSTNTYEFAENHKHDLEMMVKCSNAELQAYKETGQIPAPFYFERVAILARKQKKHALEVKVCEQYIRIIEKLKSLPPGHPRKPMIVVDHMADTFKQRLPKAKELLEKSKG